MFANNVVYFAIFLGVGDPKVTLRDVLQVNTVLGEQRLIQAILGFQVGADVLGHRFVAGQRIAGHGVHPEKGGGGDEPHGNNALDQSL